MPAEPQLPLRNVVDHQYVGACAFLNVRQIRNQLAHVTSDWEVIFCSSYSQMDASTDRDLDRYGREGSSDCLYKKLDGYRVVESCQKLYFLRQKSHVFSRKLFADNALPLSDVMLLSGHCYRLS
jgi:hypothetical protein